MFMIYIFYFFFFSSRRRHTRYWRDWSSDVCSSDLAGAPCSTISPRSMNTTRSATCRAKPISCVTQIMVMPVSARLTMVSSTSLIISGSRAEVGSSKSMILGFMHSARAIATRCCCPPESWPGYFFACSGMRTRVRYSMARASASALGIRRTQIGARVQFSSTVRCGNRLKLWNTMPTSRRMVSSARTSSLSSVPSTMIRPSWCVSSRLMQRIRVDLPLPEGPHTTTRSPRATESDTSRSTCSAPNHLLTLSIRIAGGASVRAAEATDSPGSRTKLSLMGFGPSSALAVAVQLRLQVLAVLRHGEAEHEVDGAHRQVDLHAEALPRRLDDGRLARRQQVEDADDEHQRGVLEEADEGVHQRRDHQAQRLGQDDEARLLPVGQAERVRRLVLALGQCLQPAAHHLREVGSGEEDDGDLRPQQLVDVHAFREEEREHHARHEQQRDQRHAADQLHIDHAERLDRRQARPTAERDEDRQRKGEGQDRKSTRLNSSHANISYAVFCLKKNNQDVGPCDVFRARTPGHGPPRCHTHRLRHHPRHTPHIRPRGHLARSGCARSGIASPPEH